MSDGIKKIDSINNMAVFNNFQWAKYVRDEGNNVAEFKKINIFYGHNYSGKTTLSRIFRALETGTISDKYDSPEFKLSFNDGNYVTQTTLRNHNQVIRIFNDDFIKDNLRFIVDDKQSINSFAILGEDNSKLKDEIEKYQIELGSVENKSGLLWNEFNANEQFENSQKICDDKKLGLENKLRDKANNPNNGIKHNLLFGDPIYNLTKIKKDIELILKDSYQSVTQSEIDKFHNLLKEETKSVIKALTPFNLQYSKIILKAQKLIEKKIQPSEPIQDLLNNSILETWVRDGREYHQNKRNTCGFCGGILPKDLWIKLDNHFNKESENLRNELDELLSIIDQEKNKNFPEIRGSNFYSEFKADVESLQEKLNIQLRNYNESLNEIKKQIEKRKADIFTSTVFINPNFDEDLFNKIHISFESLIAKSNNYSNLLSGKQKNAREALRLNEVYSFIIDIKYKDECDAIEKLKVEKESKEQVKCTAKEKVDEMFIKLSELKSQLKDESKGANKVNSYLNDFFGHKYLSLKAIKNDTNNEFSGFKFEITRNNKKAFHLSEGECSLIAFF